MSSPEVVLHIGLHKTATRFLQRGIFNQLDPDAFLVNPDPLFHDLRQAVRHPGDADRAATAERSAAAARRAAGSRTLLISDPSISGDMYSSHTDYPTNLELVWRLFPEARIIYFVRSPVDWLQSAYRQALVKGPGMPIERFLNYYHGRFQPRLARRVYGVRNVEALTLRFLSIYRAYADTFGPERVYLFRQEDLRRRRDRVYARLAEALGLEALPELPERISSNRSFSALAIHLFFRGVRAPSGPPGPEALAEGGRHRGRRRVATLRRFRALFVRHIFDKMIYKDWDLLARHGMRERLEAHYANEFDALTRVAEEVLDHGPGPRARAIAGESRNG